MNRLTARNWLGVWVVLFGMGLPLNAADAWKEQLKKLLPAGWELNDEKGGPKLHRVKPISIYMAVSLPPVRPGEKFDYREYKHVFSLRIQLVDLPWCYR